MSYTESNNNYNDYGTIAMILFCILIIQSFVLIRKSGEVEKWKNIAYARDSIIVVGSYKYDSLVQASSKHIDSTCKIIKTN